MNDSKFEDYIKSGGGNYLIKDVNNPALYDEYKETVNKGLAGATRAFYSNHNNMTTYIN